MNLKDDLKVPDTVLLKIKMMEIENILMNK